MGTESKSDSNAPKGRTPTVFVTDAAAESARIADTLRTAGYVVVDVPLSMLVSRAEVQKPNVVLVDVDASGALDEISKLRKVPGGGAIDFVYFGAGSGPIRNADDAMANEGSAFFPRPIDIGALVRRVESLTGGPVMRPHVRPSTPPPSIPTHRHGSVPPPERPSSPSLPAPGLRTPGPPLPMSTPSLADLVDPPRSLATFGTVSNELQQLLAEAEMRAEVMAQHPEGPVPSPEEEIETVLPADVLASLDEPIEGDEDEEHEPGGRGGGGGTGTGAGTGPGHDHRERDRDVGAHSKGTTAGGSKMTTASGRSPSSTPHTHERRIGSENPPASVRRTSDRPLTPARPSPIPPSGDGMDPITNPSITTGAGEKTAMPRPDSVTIATNDIFAAQQAAGLFQQTARFSPSDAPFASSASGFGAVGTPNPMNVAMQQGSHARSHEPQSQGSHAQSHGSHARSPESQSQAHAQSHGSQGSHAHGSHAQSHGSQGSHAQSHGSQGSHARSQGSQSQGAYGSQSGSSHAHGGHGSHVSQSDGSHASQAAGAGHASAHPTSSSRGGMSSVSPTGSGASAAPAAQGAVVIQPIDARRFLADAIAQRMSGALCFEHDRVVRRLVLRDGDLVTAASGAERESLVCFLGARGELPRDEVDRLAGKVPPYGRHAGAALVAHGWLGQDQLWTALRAHAEWIATCVLRLSGGTAQLEAEPPGRLRSEPSVFGASTGAEIFVELVRRAVSPTEAIDALGGEGSRIGDGPMQSLLAECALPLAEMELISRARGGTLGDLLTRAPDAEIASVVHGLALLGVLDVMAAPTPARSSRNQSSAMSGDAGDPSEQSMALEAAALDDEAIRARVRARLELVDEGDYFSVLGVPRDATSYEVRRAFVELRRAFEPTKILSPRLVDLADDVRKIVLVLEEAYEILRDGARRERYRRAIDARP